MCLSFCHCRSLCRTSQCLTNCLETRQLYKSGRFRPVLSVRAVTASVFARPTRRSGPGRSPACRLFVPRCGFLSTPNSSSSRRRSPSTHKYSRTMRRRCAVFWCLPPAQRTVRTSLQSHLSLRVCLVICYCPRRLFKYSVSWRVSFHFPRQEHERAYWRPSSTTHQRFGFQWGKALWDMLSFGVIVIKWIQILNNAD